MLRLSNGVVVMLGEGWNLRQARLEIENSPSAKLGCTELFGLVAVPPKCQVVPFLEDAEAWRDREQLHK